MTLGVLELSKGAINRALTLHVRLEHMVLL